MHYISVIDSLGHFIKKDNLYRIRRNFKISLNLHKFLKWQQAYCLILSIIPNFRIIYKIIYKFGLRPKIIRTIWPDPQLCNAKISAVTDSKLASESANFSTVRLNPQIFSGRHTNARRTPMAIINAAMVIVRHTCLKSSSLPTHNVGNTRWLKGKPGNLGVRSTMLSQCTVPLLLSTSVSCERPFSTAVLVTSIARHAIVWLWSVQTLIWYVWSQVHGCAEETSVLLNTPGCYEKLLHKL